MLSRPIRIVLVDDHVVVRRALASLLHSSETFLVVGEAGDGDEGIRVAQQVGPQLVLMDLSMPRLNGIEATRRLRTSQPGVQVVVLSMHDDEASVIHALQAGANGYVLKRSAPEELCLAIETVADGGLFISPLVAQPGLDRYLRDPRQSHNSDPSGLTPREIEVLHLIVDGLTTGEIATTLNISPHTAHHHRTDLKRRLGARTNAELIKIAIERKLVVEQE